MPEDNAPRKIALFVPSMDGGGAERVVLAEARELVRLGHRVDLILSLGGGELLPLLPSEVRVIQFGASRMIGGFLPLVRYLRSERPDALHATMWPSTVIAVAAHKLARSKARLVVSDQVALSRQFVDRRKRAAVMATTRLAYPVADMRICCSSAAADDVARLSGMPRDKFEVIYNPIAPPARVEASEEALRLFETAGRRLINVGNLKHQKNQHLLLRAFAKSDYRDARLVILGEGELRQSLEALAKELGIADRVAFPGFFLDPWPFYAAANMFVLSSDYEGFANVVAEALYAGLRVVSTDCVAGPREILDGGRYGQLVPVGDADALARAVDAAFEQPGHPEQSRARALEISGPAQVARYVELLTA